MTDDLTRLREAAKAGRVRWRYHALLRTRQRGIERVVALRVLLEGDVVEEDCGPAPFPKYLFMDNANRGRPLYVAASYDRVTDYVNVITVHWLDPRKWEDPWTRSPEVL